MEKYGRTRQATNGVIIRRMRIAFWINKAAETIKIYNTCYFSTTRTVMRTRLIGKFISTLPVLLMLKHKSVHQNIIMSLLYSLKVQMPYLSTSFLNISNSDNLSGFQGSCCSNYGLLDSCTSRDLCSLFLLSTFRCHSNIP